MTDLKEEMLEAIQKVYDGLWTYNEKSAHKCASIAEKRIKIARLEGFIQGLKDSLKKGVFPGEISELEKQLEELNAGKDL